MMNNVAIVSGSNQGLGFALVEALCKILGPNANVPSKVAQVASAKIMARLMREEASRRGILINAVCPGMVDMEASRPWFDDMSSAQSPAQAAMDVAWLATLPPRTETPYGELVQHREVLPWV
jgi:carbonyl reductase 1